MKNITSLALIILLVSCQNKSENKFEKIEKMDWLIGNWEQKLPNGIITETWEKENDSTFNGKSYFIKEKDTLSFESIELLQKGDVLYYIPTVKGQNSDKPVTFKLTTATEKEFTFENPAHDFPKRIVYRFVTADSLHAFVDDGTEAGKKQKFYYKRQ